jgi:RNA polymerase sigma-70 factor (ECF subfamily)
MKANAMRINKSLIMKNAWVIFRTNKQGLTFGESLKLSWANAKKILTEYNITSIYNEYYTKVLNNVTFKVRNLDDAQELTNDIFLKIDKHLQIFNPNKAKLNTWIFEITKNAIYDYYRKTKNQNLNTQISNFVDESGNETIQIIDNNTNANTIENTELNTVLMQSFDSLKEPYKSISKLYFLEQKQYNEIADLLNIPLNTVKVTLMRAKAKLQENLQAEYQLLG